MQIINCRITGEGPEDVRLTSGPGTPVAGPAIYTLSRATPVARPALSGALCGPQRHVTIS